ncbi:MULTISPECIES: GNAT family N-acetyltransferase [Paenibacillus]|uniref:GNAT family N-acetyltransferase n=1 Tax=Paenibacillus TaxID=44249 RepID=UPI00177BA29E|nr:MULTISPECIES: GNAT family N-acetyltransferase [unclassified Paenibacillus]MBD8839764.1 GNAT family N-acetyltransferase [Paenibacillus sp. CFBP 13594]MDQ0661359.1 GNAT superfamily N-acetyltransferase [Paenibacillus sp. W2I17]MDQ0719115.1 GNAT superfamily N-acetyltransferase [Paenibacillus sp. W4I10]MDR6718008.1 GNAT superfamily N-acetyltransferase [Paenibacillus sp. 2003]
MRESIHYSIEPPESFDQLLTLYESLGWNSLNLSQHELERMCKQSWYAMYAYDQQRLVGMGRVISDGVITGIICGVGVLPDYQSQGIGTELMKRIVEHCEKNKVIPQLMCTEGLETYYAKLGFEKFTIGMTKRINR